MRAMIAIDLGSGGQGWKASKKPGTLANAG